MAKGRHDLAKFHRTVLDPTFMPALAKSLVRQLATASCSITSVRNKPLRSKRKKVSHTQSVRAYDTGSFACWVHSGTLSSVG